MDVTLRTTARSIWTHAPVTELVKQLPGLVYDPKAFVIMLLAGTPAGEVATYVLAGLCALYGSVRPPKLPLLMSVNVAGTSTTGYMKLVSARTYTKYISLCSTQLGNQYIA